MMIPAFLPSILLAVASNSNSKNNPTLWFIDGNNMLGQRGIPKDRDFLTHRLEAIQQLNVQLVFDGRKGVPQRKVIEHKNLDDDGSSFSVFFLEEGLSTDDYILGEIDAMLKQAMEENQQEDLEQRRRIPRRRSQIQVVTADRDLRRRCLEAKRVVRDVVNPITFWRRYVPRLSGMKKPDTSVGDGDDDDESEVTKEDVASATV